MSDGRWERIQAVINQVKCPPYGFVLKSISPIALSVEACLWRMDTDTGQYDWGYGGKQLLQWDASEDDIAKRCFVAARDYSEHEVREAFLFKGRRVFDPHQSLDDLWSISRE